MVFSPRLVTQQTTPKPQGRRFAPQFLVRLIVAPAPVPTVPAPARAPTDPDRRARKSPGRAIRRDVAPRPRAPGLARSDREHGAARLAKAVDPVSGLARTGARRQAIFRKS